MARSPDSHRGTILPTGWRIVGQGAERVAERAAAAIERLAHGDVADTLYALDCTMDTTVEGRPTVERVLDALTDDVRRTWADCPRLVRDDEVVHPASRFGGLQYEVSAEPGKEWLGEIVWRAVHPAVAGAAITTRVLLEERPAFTRLAVRVTADAGLASVRGHVGAGQSQPAFLRALRRDLTPWWLGGPLATHPIRTGEVEGFVAGILEDPRRELPAAVLSPDEDGSFVVDPEDTAWDLLGRARLYVIRDHRVTFELSDAVGDRRMSCYWGAARCYFPGWSRHDDPIDHPLLVADRLADPVMRALWLGEIGAWTGVRTSLPASIEERREQAAQLELQNKRSRGGSPTPPAPIPSGKAPRDASAGTETAPERDSAPAIVRPASATDDGHATTDADGATSQSTLQVADLVPLLETLIRDVRGIASLVDDLTDEVERLRTISAVRSSSNSAIERRLGHLEDLLDRALPRVGEVAAPGTREAVAMAPSIEEPSDDDEGRPSLVGIVHAIAEAHSDALLFLDSAFASASDSPFEDPERVRAILEAMARVAQRRRDGVLGTSLREAFADLGIDYRPAIAKSTSARMREQYRFVLNDGERVEAEEHIALGNTYDPRRCLRIYFSSRVPTETRFVIGHVGRHFDVRSTT